MHRAAVAALGLTLLVGGSLKSQGRSWHAVGGVGGITGQSLAHRPAFIVALGRELATSSTLGFGAELTMGHLPNGNLVCIDAACDLRELARFGALSIVGVISPSSGRVTPYLRANIGAWLGSDNGATGDESSLETGATIAGETGIRFGQFAVAVRLDQLKGVRRGMMQIASMVMRVSF